MGYGININCSQFVKQSNLFFILGHSISVSYLN